MKIRDELERMVFADLHGPVGGEAEEIDEPSVRERYLVGMLAPKRQELSPEEFDELPQGGAGTIEEGTTDYTAPTTKTMFPSSFGLTFCVDLESKELQVTARWGYYSRQRSATLTTPTGEKKLVWKRSQRQGVSKPITLQVGRVQWAPDADFPQVQVQGIIRKRDQFWSVTLFLVNGQEEPKKLRDTAWLFQPELIVQAPDGRPIFHSRPQQRDPGKSDPMTFAEEQEMAMLYRNHVEFGVGHGVSIHAECPEGVCDRAVSLSTRVVPAYEVPQTTPPTVADLPKLDGLVLDMMELGQTKTAQFDKKLRPLLTAYDAWIKDRETDLKKPDMAMHKKPGQAALDRCRTALARIEAGLKLLTDNDKAAEAFRFANLAMWQQRVHTMISLKKRRDEAADERTIDIPKNRSWYPFQLAFMLLNLPGITKLDHKDRIGEAEAVADLLWFPTGGGKTEAYLGLSAYTMGLRRLQGTVAGRSGEHGVAVLMRYTLRLLTIQQFQRATALICACEIIRRSDEKKWGKERFRIGLWVGAKVTPNTTEQSAESISQEHGSKPYQRRKEAGSPVQLTSCPWCGSKVNPGQNLKVESYAKGRCRTLVYCGDVLGRCPFSAKQSPLEGIPVLVVDEEIYRRLPTLLIATVDKFAQMPWNGKVQMLFGQVEGHCERHGFVSPQFTADDTELKPGSQHPKTKTGLPPAKVTLHPAIRPPDLIIQDELHLISGPLGTLVGLYETAVDKLCSWDVDGKTVRPKVVASTATIRKAGDQVHATFLRKVSVFPPHGLEVQDNFFSLRRKPSEELPGRRYIGICAPGRRLKVALIRVYVALLGAAQTLYEKKGYGKDVDPWMTLIGYFNSMRELGGMRRLVEDDVRTRLGKIEQRGLVKRSLYVIDELTSRKDSTDIPETLDHLEVAFDPQVEAKRKEMQKKGFIKDMPRRPLDVLLATNMVSVGVDVQRLGLMVVAGQPKTTAEFIQATSRVGRRHPGLVVTVYNWTRPRDLSHYETFEQYHATFYKHVEALSVTPFAQGALSRGLTAILVSCIRHPGTEFNSNKQASRIERNHPYVQQAVKAIVERAKLVGNSDDAFIQLLQTELNERLDQWLAEAQRNVGGRILGYDDERDGVTVGLLRRPGLDPWDDFTCLNSLRDVEPTVGLIFHDGGLDEDPNFVAAVSEDTDSEEQEQP
jgi:hypothetical protein